MKVLTLQFGPETYEIHMLNVGDMFPEDFDPAKFNGFGGSRHPLIAGHDYQSGEKHKKPTASLIVRRIGAMGLEDKERDITDPHFWAWIARMLNISTLSPDVATVDPAHGEEPAKAMREDCGQDRAKRDAVMAEFVKFGG